MPILKRPGQLLPDSADPYGLFGLISNNNTYSTDLINVSQSGTNITLTQAQTPLGVLRLIGAAANNFTVTLPPTARIIDQLGPTIARDGTFACPISVQNEDTTFQATLVAGDGQTTISGTATIAAGTRRIFALTVGTPYDPTVVFIQNIGTFGVAQVNSGPPGGVTSVGLTEPVEFIVSGSPVTSTGTLAVTKAVEPANTVWAGPTSGVPAQPTFRTLVAGDLPPGGVTSVGLTAPVEFLVSGSPVTTSGTLAITKVNENANTVWAGPTSGAPAIPTFRALVSSDLPAGGGGGVIVALMIGM